MRVEVVRQGAHAVDGVSEADVELLGCLSLVCRAAGGRGYPFILQPMRIRGIAAGDAADPLPRCGRLRLLYGRHRPLPAPARPNLGRSRR
jgi:hypothetical protein